ncbi:hypothetical protein V1478_018528 [Vespula squamosa]|uniref:Uncharacterized protein n=1 Tax=Vespula squamosa TaxID=30214 RepID=A0ABD1ZTK8_VESSQ
MYNKFNEIGVINGSLRDGRIMNLKERQNCSDSFKSRIILDVSPLVVKGRRGRKTKKQDGFQFDPMESAVVAGRGDKCDGYR